MTRREREISARHEHRRHQIFPMRFALRDGVWRHFAMSAALCVLSLSLPLHAQTWSELGPSPITNVSYAGRVSSLACSPSDPDLYYVAGADGGVWRTRDGGQSWTPITDFMPTTAIGAVALDPSDENIIYAGTGEANYANHSRYGLGLYKSTDGGDTWQHLAENVFAGRTFSKIVIDHQNTQILYAAIARAGGFPALAAAKGHPGATGPVGVFRSTDGGATWTHLTNGIPGVEASDLAIDPVDPRIIYAAIGNIFGHAGNGIYKSTNGGDSWTKLAGGLPTTDVGRIALAIAPSDRTRLYTLIAQEADASGGSAQTRGAWRSDNSGATWTGLSALPNIQSTYGWYLCVLAVHPANRDLALFGGLTLRRTSNGGASFSNVTPPHVDLHALGWDAAGRLLAGEDGGVHRSPDNGNTWFSLNEGLGTIQFYAGLSTHPTDPGIVIGGAQDNGTNRRDSGGQTWTHIFGGDGGWTQLDRTNPQRIFVEYQGAGNLYFSNNGGDTFDFAGSGIDPGDRNAFLPPFLINPLNPQRMLYGTQRVYRSTNAGQSWSAITGDLSDGGGAIRALAQSPSDPQIVYAATNDGNIHVSFDEGGTFTQIENDHAGWPRVTREIVVSDFDPLRAHLAGATFGVDQVRRTRDAGLSWIALDGNLPDIPVNVVADNAQVAGQLFAGTDAGVFITHDDGTTWARYGEGLPNVPVIDLQLDHAHGRIVVGTQGRGAWSAPLVPGAVAFDEMEVVLGTLLDGDLDHARRDDDRNLRFRSEFGFQFIEPYLVEARFSGDSPIEDPQEIRIAVRARVDAISARLSLRLFNWNTGRFDRVGAAMLHIDHQFILSAPIDAFDYVRANDGHITAAIWMTSTATFQIGGFDAHVDVVQVTVE